MKLLLCADLHFGVKSSVESNSGNKNLGGLFFDKTVECLDHMFNKHKDDVDAIVILGDVYDRRVTSDNKIMMDSIKFFSRHTDKKIIILVGNHDCYYNNTNEYNTVETLQLIYPNITVVPESTMELDDVLIVNWVNEENRESITDAIRKSTKPYLFGHFDVVGGNLGAGRISEKGFDKNEFKHFENVFTGHYHTQSTVANVVYVGNPIQTKISEHDESKGVIILDTTTKEWVRDNYDLKLFYRIDYDSIYTSNDFTMYTDKIVELKIDRSSLNYTLAKHEELVNNIRSVATSITVIITNVVKADSDETKRSIDISDGANLLELEMTRLEFNSIDKKYVTELYQKSKNELGE